MSPHEGQEQVSPTFIPRHVAIIMDGNGRWAKARGLDRSEGHVAGVDSLREAVTSASPPRSDDVGSLAPRARARR